MNITSYELPLTAYPLTPPQEPLLRRFHLCIMNRKIFYNDQVFRSPSLPGDPGDLPGLQPPGGRLGTYQAQLSQEPTDRAEYYAVRPRRSREAYKRQYDRSASAMPEHCRLVEEVLAEQPEGIVQRVHVKGDSNATADNAHVIVIIEKRAFMRSSARCTTGGSAGAGPEHSADGKRPEVGHERNLKRVRGQLPA